MFTDKSRQTLTTLPKISFRIIWLELLLSIKSEAIVRFDMIYVDKQVQHLNRLFLNEYFYLRQVICK